jgi:hypothetical protein
LKEYAKSGLIRLIVKKCSRGRGRQIAFENSNGKYIIANMDLDDTFFPKLRDLLDFYHRFCKGKILLAVKGTSKSLRGLQNITIGSRNLIEELGGWRDLQWAEDWDLWCRAAKKGTYAWTVFTVVKEVSSHPERLHTTKKLYFRYVKYRELLRLKRPIFDVHEEATLTQRIILLLASLGAMTREKYIDTFNRIFDPYYEGHYVEFRSTLHGVLRTSSGIPRLPSPK